MSRVVVVMVVVIVAVGVVAVTVEEEGREPKQRFCPMYFMYILPFSAIPIKVDCIFACTTSFIIA